MISSVKVFKTEVQRLIIVDGQKRSISKKAYVTVTFKHALHRESVGKQRLVSKTGVVISVFVVKCGRSRML